MSKTKMSLISFFVLIAVSSCTAQDSSATTKKSVLAGRWYPSHAGDLSKQIDGLLDRSDHKKNYSDAALFILPHAGYQYSGATAAAGYRIIGGTGKSNINPDLIVLLGPSHHAAFRGCCADPVDYYETPLGKVKINRKIADKLRSDKLFNADSSAFDNEHSIEIHLPFLQRIFGHRLLGEIQVLPLLVGELNDGEAVRVAAGIARAIEGTNPLFIVSSDFTHYGPNFGYTPFGNAGRDAAFKIKELDAGAIAFILKKDLSGFSNYVDKTGITICGRNPIKIALALPITGYKSELISYDTSGNITGDYTNSVSYTAIAYRGTITGATVSIALDMNDKKFLLKAARDNIASWLAKKKGIQIFPTSTPPNCLVKRGVFVTLKSRGNLRGCVGYLFGEKPIIQVVLDCSYNAAFKDPRFMPLKPEELKNIVIEISVLTEPKLIKKVDEIKTGRDGLYIEQGMYRGLLLPQVATEQGWDRNTFLSQACLKAGLPQTAWKDPATKIYRFQAVVFSEEGLK